MNITKTGIGPAACIKYQPDGIVCKPSINSIQTLSKKDICKTSDEILNMLMRLHKIINHQTSKMVFIMSKEMLLKIKPFANISDSEYDLFYSGVNFKDNAIYIHKHIGKYQVMTITDFQCLNVLPALNLFTVKSYNHNGIDLPEPLNSLSIMPHDDNLSDLKMAPINVDSISFKPQNKYSVILPYYYYLSPIKWNQYISDISCLCAYIEFE